DFGTPAHGLSQAGSADGHDHEFLEVDRIVGVSATIEDVHHRHRKHMGAGTPHITVERKVCRFCCRLGDRQGYAKDGIGTESALVWRAVQFDHDLVDVDLVLGIHAADGLDQLSVYCLHGALDSLAEIA